MCVSVYIYACVSVDGKQILLLGSYYFELAHNNLQNNSFQPLEGKHLNYSQILDINLAV